MYRAGFAGGGSINNAGKHFNQIIEVNGGLRSLGQSEVFREAIDGHGLDAGADIPGLDNQGIVSLGGDLHYSIGEVLHHSDGLFRKDETFNLCLRGQNRNGVLQIIGTHSPVLHQNALSAGNRGSAGDCTFQQGKSLDQLGFLNFHIVLLIVLLQNLKNTVFELDFIGSKFFLVHVLMPEAFLHGHPDFPGDTVKGGEV